MEYGETFHPFWRYSVFVMLAWCVFAAAWLTYEIHEQYQINCDIEGAQSGDERQAERAKERLAAAGEEASLYLLQELNQTETSEASIRPVVALEKVVRGHAWMIGYFQRRSLNSMLDEFREAPPGSREALIAGVIERAFEAIGKAEQGKDTPFPISRAEVAAIKAIAEKRRREYWARRRRLAEALAVTMERMGKEGQSPGRLVLHGIVELLGDESPTVRRNVSRSCQALGEPIVPWLIKNVEHENVQPLMVVGTSDYTKEENENRLSAQNDRRRMESVKLLGTFIGVPKARKILERYAKDPVVGAEARRILAAKPKGKA